MSYVTDQKQNAQPIQPPQKSWWQRLLDGPLIMILAVAAVAAFAYFIAWPAIKLNFKRQEMAIEKIGQGDIGAGMALEAPELIRAVFRR